MKRALPVNEDIILLQQSSKKRQIAAFLNLLKSNENRIKPYFPGFYIDGVSQELVEELIQNKEKAFQKNEVTSYAICSRKKKRIIGEVLIYHSLNESSISYWVDKQSEGKGIISSAFDKVRSELFQEGVSGILASCDAKNEKSIQFLKNKGLKPIATYRNQQGKKFIDFYQTRQEFLFLKRLNQHQQDRA